MAIIKVENGTVDTLAPEYGSFDEPFESLIFIGVTNTGSDFFFINAVNKRFEFRWDKWSQFKDVLQPLTFHCFKVKSYQTNTASSHGFTPIEHICEFAGIKHARLFNREYLERWFQFKDLDVKTATDETRDFCIRLKEHTEVQVTPLFEVIKENISEYFASSISKEELEWALAVSLKPSPNFIELIDTSDLLNLIGDSLSV